MASYSVIDIEQLEGEGPGGAVRKLRRELGATAFGFNHFRLPPHVTGREHDHADDGQEEVYVVLKGSGVMRVDDDEIDVRPGIVVRVDGPATRVATAGHEGLEFITFGAPVEGRYVPPEWG
jgi:mannose-6-phosphate isomerase-like protein (cupin superfamily)